MKSTTFKDLDCSLLNNYIRSYKCFTTKIRSVGCTYTEKSFRRLIFHENPLITKKSVNLHNQPWYKPFTPIKHPQGYFSRCKLITPCTVFFIDKPFLCICNRYTLKLTVDYVPGRNSLLRVYLLQECKMGSSMKKTVQGFITLQREKYP